VASCAAMRPSARPRAPPGGGGRAATAPAPAAAAPRVGASRAGAAALRRRLLWGPEEDMGTGWPGVGGTPRRGEALALLSPPAQRSPAQPAGVHMKERPALTRGAGRVALNPLADSETEPAPTRRPAPLRCPAEPRTGRIYCRRKAAHDHGPACTPPPPHRGSLAHTTSVRSQPGPAPATTPPLRPRSPPPGSPPARASAMTRAASRAVVMAMASRGMATNGSSSALATSSAPSSRMFMTANWKGGEEGERGEGASGVVVFAERARSLLSPRPASPASVPGRIGWPA